MTKDAEYYNIRPYTEKMSTDPTPISPEDRANIQRLLNNVRGKMYGDDIRESIALSIQKTYDDASEKDNANMEVKIARGTHPNLRSRLEEVDNKQQKTETRLNNVISGLTGEEEFYIPIGLEEYMTTEGQEWNI